MLYLCYRQHCRLSVFSYFGWLWQILRQACLLIESEIDSKPAVYLPMCHHTMIQIWKHKYANDYRGTNTNTNTNISREIDKANEQWIWDASIPLQLRNPSGERLRPTQLDNLLLSVLGGKNIWVKAWTTMGGIEGEEVPRVVKDSCLSVDLIQGKIIFAICPIYHHNVHTQLTVTSLSSAYGIHVVGVILSSSAPSRPWQGLQQENNLGVFFVSSNRVSLCQNAPQQVCKASTFCLFTQLTSAECTDCY